MSFSKICLVFILVFTKQTLFAQSHAYAQDIPRFWEAFDSIQLTNDISKQKEYIQKLYIDKATVGLKEFMELKGGNAEKWVRIINDEMGKKKLLEVRPFSLNALQQVSTIEDKLKLFKQLYSNYKDGDIFFTIGVFNSGGTAKGNHSLIGTEVVANGNNPDWAVPIVLHEFVHTQQKGESLEILAEAIIEGGADFVSELVYGKPLTGFYRDKMFYITWGKKHEKEVWNEFKTEMFLNSPNNSYNGWIGSSKNINGTEVKDLGYFMGYTICKAYYEKASDKRKALQEVIEFDTSNPNAGENFLLASGYLKGEKIDKFKLHEQYLKKESQKRLIYLQKNGLKSTSTYGYKLNADSLTFVISNDELKRVGYDGKEKTVKSVVVAGEFNAWNKNAEGFSLKQTSKFSWELTLPKSKIGDKNKEYLFKFVVNDDNWIEPAIEAENKQVSKEGHTNLVLKL